MGAQKKKKIRSQKFGVVRLRYRASLDPFFDFCTFLVFFKVFFKKRALGAFFK